MEAVKAFVESDEAFGVSLTEMARRCGTNEKLLLRDFRSAFGTTIFNYIKTFRLTESPRGFALRWYHGRSGRPFRRVLDSSQFRHRVQTPFWHASQGRASELAPSRTFGGETDRQSVGRARSNNPRSL